MTAEPMTPEQRAELAWSEGWGCSRDLQVRCIADAIRSAVEAEREAIASTYDERAKDVLEKADRLAKGHPGLSEELRRCAAQLDAEAAAIRSPSQEAANG